ncbi:MAG: DUF4145 domain-containing protein [Candidatus Woesearchaeota archaeon]
MPDFAHLVADLKEAIEKARKESISLAPEKQGTFKDFMSQRREQLRRAVYAAMSTLTKESAGVLQGRASKIVQEMQITQDLQELGELADELLSIVTDEYSQSSFSIRRPRVPFEIHDIIQADIEEIKRCMENRCFRSAVILCGRILETALHRKYYDVTKNDLLEKSPGIGLGNLIAKLSEQGITLDPGLGNQIHLINQVRIHSVHQKQNAFAPSEAQAQAIVLYTMDVLEKLFS